MILKGQVIVFTIGHDIGQVRTRSIVRATRDFDLAKERDEYLYYADMEDRERGRPLVRPAQQLINRLINKSLVDPAPDVQLVHLVSSGDDKRFDDQRFISLDRERRGIGRTPA
jgi:hypothetical protein